METDTYKIIFTTENLKQDKNTVSFTDASEFVEWYFKNKSTIKQAKIRFETKLEHITLDSINSLYKFLKFYQKTKKSCDGYMEKYNKQLLAVEENEMVSDILKELVRINDGGKFLRATLIALGYQASGHKDNKYLNLAIALEIFQTSILAHDDFIDSDSVRRGKPTIPAAYKVRFDKKNSDKKYQKTKDHIADSMGIIAGDLGFYLASGLIIDGYKNHPNLSEVLSYYNQMVIKTCKGEVLDVGLSFKERYFKNNKNLNEQIFEIYKLKTAWYSVIGPFCLGMILGGTPQKQIKKYEKILLNAGVAFQIKDDILGMFGNEKHTGKPNTSDAEEYKQTILYSYVLNTEYKDEMLKYYGKSNLTDKEAKKLLNIFTESGAKAYAKKTMNDLFQTSLKELEEEDLPKNSKDILKGFIIYLRHRSK